jgi:Ca2+-binding EF-hand superfamily protein
VGLAVLFKLRHIYALLLPPVEEQPSTAGSVNRAVELEEDKALLPASRGAPRYVVHNKRACCAHSGNKHESLFWFGRRGPQVLLRVLSALLFLSSLLGSVFGVWFVLTVWREIEVVALRFVLYVLVVAPLLVTVLLVCPLCIRLWVVASKIELLKHHKTIKRTLLEMRMQKVVRAIRLLNALRVSLEVEVEEASKKEGEEHGEGKGKEEGGGEGGAKQTPEEVLGHEKVEEARILFVRHAGSDGVLDAEEVGPMLAELGIRIAPEIAETLYKKMDKDGNGVSFDEFCEHLASVATVSHKGPMTEEDIEQLHKLLDRSQTGEVSIEDFSVCFESLGIHMSVGELNAFVRELDEDDSGTISVEELVKFLKKYTQDA